ARDNFASGLGIPQTNVRVICQYMGGGFGSKLQLGPEGLICARLARQAGVPVKLTLDRKEEHLVTGNRPSAAAKNKAGVSADGVVTPVEAEAGGTAGPARAAARRRVSRCPTSTRSPIGAAPTRTSSSTRACSGRCVRRAIRRDRSSPRS